MKPKDPAPVQMALKLLGIENVSKTNMRDDIYGDTVDDIRASTAAGIVGVGNRRDGKRKSFRCRYVLNMGWMLECFISR